MKKKPVAQPEITNTMTDMVSSLIGGAFLQDNLTSFLPMVTANIYAPLTLNWTLLMYIYKTHGIIQTAIDEPVLDAFRGGLEYVSDDMSSDEISELEQFMEENNVWQPVKDTCIWARLFGGAGLVINPQNVADTTTALDMKELQGGKLDLYDACRWELGSEQRFSDRYQFYDVKLHKSRVITIAGKRAPFVIRRQLAGWGMSEIEKMVEDFNLFLRTRNVLYELLDEAKVDVYGIEGFKESLATDVGSQAIRRRIQLSNQLKNFQRALVMDKNDTYEQKQITFSGIAEVMKENRMGLASALRMPISKIFGVAATGFSSGEDDIENYNAMVESQVREPAKPLIREVLNLCCMAVFGDLPHLEFKYKPLRVLSAEQEEKVKNDRQTRTLDLYDRYLVTSEEVGQTVQKDNLMPIPIAAADGGVDEHPQPPAMPGQDGEGEEEKPTKKPGDKDD